MDIDLGEFENEQDGLILFAYTRPAVLFVSLRKSIEFDLRSGKIVLCDIDKFR